MKEGRVDCIKEGRKKGRKDVKKGKKEGTEEGTKQGTRERKNKRRKGGTMEQRSDLLFLLFGP